MSTNNGASNTVLKSTSVTTQPMTGITVPAMNYAVAFQQYHQPLLNPQLLLQQQPVAMSSLSIEAAAKQAAARAAEISKLLKGENNGEPKEKMEETATKREHSASNSHSQSPSHSASSKSKSASPIRYRSSRVEREKYSPRDNRRYRGYRHSNYYIRGYDDQREYHRSNYRRYSDYYHGRDYSYYSRSRRRSLSKSRSLRYRHGESLSPRRRRSPSPWSNRNISARGLNRHTASRSPVKRSHTSSSSPCSRSSSPRKPVARRSLSSSRNTQDGSISSASVKDNRAANHHGSCENDSGVDSEGWKNKQMGFKEQLKKSDLSRSSQSSESTSIDRRNERFWSQPNLKNATTAQLASASRSHSSYSKSSEKGPSPRDSGRTDYRSDPAVSSPQTSTDDADGTLHKMDHRSSIDHGDADDRHDEMVVMRGERRKFCDSTAERRAKENSINPSSSDNLTLSPRGSQPETGCWESTSDDAKVSTDTNKCAFKEMHPSEEGEHESSKVQNRTESDIPLKAIRSSKDLAYSPGVGMDNRTEVNMDCRKWSGDMMVVENFVNKCSHSIMEASNHHHHEYHSTPSEFAGLPFPKVDESMVENLMLKKNHDELEQDPEYYIRTPVRLPGVPWVETADVEVTESPLLYCYPEEKSKRRSRSKQRRKHGKRHHKKRTREESEEYEDYEKKHGERKL